MLISRANVNDCDIIDTGDKFQSDKREVFQITQTKDLKFDYKSRMIVFTYFIRKH